VAGRSKVLTVFARYNTEIVGWNPIGGMDVCVCLFFVCVVLNVGSGFASADPPSKESYRLRIGLVN
jgi:hypothetical protein